MCTHGTTTSRQGHSTISPAYLRVSWLGAALDPNAKTAVKPPSGVSKETSMLALLNADAAVHFSPWYSTGRDSKDMIWPVLQRILLVSYTRKSFGTRLHALANKETNDKQYHVDV
mmetsp:Transcript_70252/g.187194  ORF Transcript_70252/g.187194 Transcript_70252/m.187194 type:complete len:115 (+) Transcript_70252:276-620(+)